MAWQWRGLARRRSRQRRHRYHRIRLNNTAQNQDACKHVRVRIFYTAR
jgi:hypothetical protein